MNTLDLLHGDNYERKVASETTFFRWVWPVVPLVQSDFRIFFIIDLSKRNLANYLFWLDLSVVPLVQSVCRIL